MLIKRQHAVPYRQTFKWGVSQVLENNLQKSVITVAELLECEWWSDIGGSRHLIIDENIIINENIVKA